MEKVDRYRLTRRIGAGSFATVWHGHDDDLDVPVAMKILAENWSENEEIRQRFLAEARIMRRINSERVVRVYDIGDLPDDRPYFVMDFADGGSLNDRRHDGVSPAEGLRLCGQACQALQVLHDNDVVHRDATPGNMLLTHDRRNDLIVVVADLGVAKSMLTASGSTMAAGTPAYMAPEQAWSPDGLSPLCDVYSLAATTYAILTGKPPFPVTSISDVLSRDASQHPNPIADRIGAPAELDQVLSAALSLDPAERPSTAAALGAALDRAADGMTSNGSHTQDRPSSPPSSVPSPSSGIESPSRTEPVAGAVPGQDPARYGTDRITPEPGPTGGQSPGSAPEPRTPQPLRTGNHPLLQQPMHRPATSATSGTGAAGGKHGAGFYLLIGFAAAVIFATSLLATLLIVD